MGPVRQNQIQRTVRTAHLSVLMTVHNFSKQYNTEQFWQSPLLPPDKHHSSDAVYWRGGKSYMQCSMFYHRFGPRASYDIINGISLTAVVTDCWQQQTGKHWVAVSKQVNVFSKAPHIILLWKLTINNKTKLHILYYFVVVTCWLFACVLLARCYLLWNLQKIRCLFSIFSEKNVKIVKFYL